jgi:hypothetical protein
LDVAVPCVLVCVDSRFCATLIRAGVAAGAGVGMNIGAEGADTELLENEKPSASLAVTVKTYD